MKRSLVFLTLLSSGICGGLLACLLSFGTPAAQGQTRPAPLTPAAGALQSGASDGEATAVQSIAEPLPAASIDPDRRSQIANIRLKAPRRKLRAAGDKIRISVTLLDADQQTMGGLPELRWSSSDPEIFSVDAEGLVTARKDEGRAQILVELVGTKVEAALPLHVSLADTIQTRASALQNTGVWVHKD